MTEPRSVAVLGGGAGALAAAFELTSADDWRERFKDVTVYVPGWRLGGKGASGRNAEHSDRIEEHGLHVWFGFYNEAFWLLSRAYEALGDAAPAVPWTKAFSPIDKLVLWDRDGDEPRPWELTLPAAELDPSPAAPVDPAAATTRRLHSLWRDALQDIGVPGIAIPNALQRAVAVAEASPADDLPALRETARLMRLAVDVQRVGEKLFMGPLDPPFELRRLNRLLDFWTALLSGLVDENVLRPPGSFDPDVIARLDEVEFREWLRPRTRFPDTLDMSFVRVLYDLAFAYEDGDPERPNVAAGMAVQNLFRILFQHGGSLMLRMEGGMGDVVFAPLYKALHARGVQFRFFRHVTKLGLSKDRRAVDTIELVEQARVPGGAEYEPLVRVGDEWCWPSRPRFEKLEEEDRDEDADFELTPDPLGRGTTTLRRGADFDAVVLGIPVGALDDICGELAEANPSFEAMLENSRTVATQALQLWIAGDEAQPALAPERPSIAGGLSKPFDTYCDMTHLVHHETWPAGCELGQIAYLCGTLNEAAGDDLATATEAAERVAEQRVAAGALIGPDGRSGGTVADQYVRVNTIGGERYVLTTAGSVKHRLAPGESGFENLVLAGDWTRTTINAGSVEAAVQSGRIAAASLMADAPARLGAPRRAGERAYVDYGGLTNAPGPLLCAGTTLYGFWARCDRDQLQTLCRQVIEEPTAGAVSATPLLDHAVITFGVIDSIVPQTPPFNRMGEVTERHAAVWVPIRLRGPDGTPQIGVFLPYLWLDDPISIASGREVYGYAKNWGEPRFPGDRRGGVKGRVPPPGEPNRFYLDAWSIRSFDTGEHPKLNRLIEITRAGPLGTTGPFGSAGVLGTVTDWLKRDHLEDLLDTARTAVNSLGFARDEIEDLGDSLDAIRAMLRQEVNQIFLRQFRDPAGGGASQLQVVCAPARVSPGSFSAKVLGPHRLALSELDSHPLGTQLGLESGPLGPCFRVKMDFTVDHGRVLWGR